MLAFRSAVLADRLLVKDQIIPWLRDSMGLQARAAWDRIPFRYWHERLTIKQAKAEEAEGAARLQKLVDALPKSLTPEEREEVVVGILATTDLGTPERSLVVYADETGPLGHLRRLASTLVERYRWDFSEALRFILSGEVPRFPLARASASAEPEGSIYDTWITLEVNPHVRPKEVAKLYDGVRRQLYRSAGRPTKWRGRPQTPKHTELARFVGPRNQGRSWPELMAKWNQTHPKQWRYTDAKNFGRDAREAFRRVTGKRLTWWRKHGRPSRHTGA